MSLKKRIVYIVASALLASLAWYDVTSLGLLVMLVPLLVMQDECKGRGFLLSSAVMLALWSLLSIWWVAQAAVIGVISAIIVTVVPYGAVLGIYNYVWKRAPRSLAYTLLVTGWIAADYSAINGEISFPWLVVGNGFAIDTPIVQWYEYTGAMGGTLWALVVNILVFHAIKARRERSSGAKRAIVAVCVATALPIAISLVRYFTYPQDSGERVEVAILQPNIDPYNKFGGLTRKQQLDILLGSASGAPESTQLFIAPETALDGSYWIHTLGSNSDIVALKRFLAENYPQASFITGATLLEYYKGDTPPTTTARKADGYSFDVYNSALLIDREGVEDIYHKSKLVIGVEMLPFHEYLKFIEAFSVDLGGISGVLGTQEERSVFRSGGVDISPAICYESVYGEHFAGFVASGAQVMAVITNDGWWGDTPGYNQHLSYSRLRAVETRRDIVRSANTGISAVIDQRGDIVDSLGWDRRGMIAASVTKNSHITPYVMAGDYIGRISCYIFALSLLYYVAYRRKRKDHLYQK